MMHTGSRPEEWWAYEKQMDRPANLGCERIALFEMGELSEAELAELMLEWRQCYERAQAPGFSYCIGSRPGETFARWLMGAAARRAEYRWAGIPRAILKKWDARRARAIKARAMVGRARGAENYS